MNYQRSNKLDFQKLSKTAQDISKGVADANKGIADISNEDLIKYLKQESIKQQKYNKITLIVNVATLITTVISLIATIISLVNTIFK